MTDAVKTTQSTHPWRATVRTAFAAVVGLAAMTPFVIDAAGINAADAAGVIAFTGAVTRVLALPQVETFLRTFLPWLAAGVDAQD